MTKNQEVTEFTWANRTSR